ncbi:sulfotransferase domain-containing protein [Bosea sp. 124]|uniref:sulfotransferase domain-containing protein n=1 Tax=Bosea sp. 124 TaxID=2135642 RepID=UPI000D33AF76|nr:sulfotransferase domain-containing protein [Bosea sp. 124]PTM40341.1 sulfotransferase domain-containing protein [Bosea sp. 124]
MTDFTEAARSLDGLLSRVLHCPMDTVPKLDARPKILLASAPKSGSTWLTMLLSENFELPAVRGYLEGGHNEQEIDFIQFSKQMGNSCLFVQQHIRASDPTIRICLAFNTKIVVQTRNLCDTLVSFHDHILNESDIASMFFVKTEWFSEFTHEKRFDFLIEHCLPWYINFLTGWLSARNRYPCEILFVRYEDLINDVGGVISRISRFSGLGQGVDATKYRQVTGNLRLNEGRSGRGSEMLTPNQLTRIERLLSYYPNDLGYAEFAFAR